MGKNRIKAANESKPSRNVIGFLSRFKKNKEAKNTNKKDFNDERFKTYGTISEVTACLQLLHGEEFKEEIEELKRIQEKIKTVKSWNELYTIYAPANVILEKVHGALNSHSAEGA